MEMALKQTDPRGGVIGGIQTVAQHLMKHFPALGVGQGELPDKLIVVHLNPPFILHIAMHRATLIFGDDITA